MRVDRTPPSWEELNAYVDGELSSADAARIARAVASDPALAGQVAAISEVKNAVSEGGGASPVALPGQTYQVPRMLAAMIALVAIIGLTSMLLANLATTEETWLHHAWAVHDRLSAEPGDERSPDTGAVRASALAGQPFIPDLSSARLEARSVRFGVAMFGDDALAVSYHGSRGCRLTLLSFVADETLGEAFSTVQLDGRTAYGWRVAGRGYLVMADGMAAARFDLVARSLHWAIVQRARLEKDMQTALAESRRASPPCAHA